MSNPVPVGVTNDLLPFDVLNQIFLLVASDPAIFPTPSNEPSKILSAVCTTWRTTVLNSAHLWNRFTITSTPEKEHAPGALVFSKMCLSRAAAAPLSVSIIGAPCRSSLLDELIIPNCARFKQLTISLLWRDIGDILSLSFELIERLTIVSYPDASQVRLPNTISRFPHLRHMAIHVFPQRQSTDPDKAFGDLHILRMPLAKLVTLEFQPILSVARVHEILESCPSLEICSFLVSTKNPPAVTRVQSAICLPALKSLTIFGQYYLGDAVAMVLDPLLLPALGYVKFWRGDCWAWRHEGFVSCIQRSQCDLRRLCIGNLVCPAFDLRAILMLTPNLKELGCPRGRSTTHAIDSIVKSECTRGLKKLYANLTGYYESTDQLLDMLEAQQHQAREGPSAFEREPSNIEEIWIGGTRYEIIVLTTVHGSRNYRRMAL